MGGKPHISNYKFTRSETWCRCSVPHPFAAFWRMGGKPQISKYKFTRSETWCRYSVPHPFAVFWRMGGKPQISNYKFTRPETWCRCSVPHPFAVFWRMGGKPQISKYKFTRPETWCPNQKFASSLRCHSERSLARTGVPGARSLRAGVVERQTESPNRVEEPAVVFLRTSDSPHEPEAVSPHCDPCYTQSGLC